jgi:hypothetical protein
VHEVVEGWLPASAVFQPFFADLVAAHTELPYLRWYGLEILRLVDVDIARLALLVDCKLGKSLLHEVVSRDGIAGEICNGLFINSPLS